MKSIKVKLRETLPHDEELLRRKKFKTVLTNFKELERNYKNTGAIYGAIVGLSVFVGVVSWNIIHENQNIQPLPNNEAQILRPSSTRTVSDMNQAAPSDTTQEGYQDELIIETNAQPPITKVKRSNPAQADTKLENSEKYKELPAEIQKDNGTKRQRKKLIEIEYEP